jgi:hypothetical protein
MIDYNHTIMSSFKENESGFHKSAKQILCEWLNKDIKTEWCGDGAIMEYPLCEYLYPEGCSVVGYGYNQGDGHYDDYDSLTSSRFNPTYEQCLKIGHIPFAVVDIAVIYKGFIKECFEIYHTNKVNNDKINKLKRFYGEDCPCIYEIKAEDILRCTEKPKDIYKLCKKII